MPSIPTLALVGQPNCGKSTLFNALTGLRQHIANYPGVTVEKKTGASTLGGRPCTVIDLPGTYSLTAFSPEERVVRSFLMTTPPDLVVSVVDATNLRRGLHLTFQILELGLPLVVVLNMSDVARRHRQPVDAAKLSERLGCPVVETVGRKGEGVEALKEVLATALSQASPPTHSAVRPDYGPLEADLAFVHKALPLALKSRWLALTLLAGDQDLEAMLTRATPSGTKALIEEIARHRQAFEQAQGTTVADHIIVMREQTAATLAADCVPPRQNTGPTLTERVDRVLLNRWLAPVVLFATVLAIYHTAIVQGYELTHFTWPLLAGARNMVADWLPAAGFLVDPLTRSLGLWLVDSVNTLLNYVPIFLILFAMIAALEDSGYMARIAFILDRVLNRFGLHGQSTLPFILGGVFAGGCAVPGVMATRGIPDPRARLATILTVPYMNCLAKVPLYTLLIGIFFVDHKGLMMFFIATITIMVALLVARLLTRTILLPMETVPFVMEMPRYHLPTVGGVLRRAVDRTWLYIKKVGTVVVAVAVVIFVLLHLPGLSTEEQQGFDDRAGAALQEFHAAIADTPYAAPLADPQSLVEVLNLASAYRARRMNATTAEAVESLNARLGTAHPDWFPLVNPPRGDAAAREVNRALRTLDQQRRTLRLEMQETRIVNSLLGRVGRGLEPVTQAAGFDWKINVALLSSFAARESSVATLGVLFQQEEGGTETLEQRMGASMAQETAALVALALIVFFAIYPPCLATTIMVRIQTGSTGWMIFSIVFPTILGLVVASGIYSLGTAFNLDALTMMMSFWLGTLALLLVVGLWPRRFSQPLNSERLAPQTGDTPP